MFRLLLLFSNLVDVSGAVTAEKAAVMGFSTVTGDRFDVLSAVWKLASKFDSARIAVDAELPTLIVVSGDGEDAWCCCCSFASPGEFPALLICFDTCWLILVDGLSLYPVGWLLSFRFATLLLSLSCCVWNVFFLAELFSAAWIASELSDLQYSCWSPVRRENREVYDVNRSNGRDFTRDRIYWSNFLLCKCSIIMSIQKCPEMCTNQNLYNMICGVSSMCYDAHNFCHWPILRNNATTYKHTRYRHLIMPYIQFA